MKKAHSKVIGLIAILVFVFANCFVSFHNNASSELELGQLAKAQTSVTDKGTLYGNGQGEFCCCPGTNDCAAADCDSEICK